MRVRVHNGSHPVGPLLALGFEPHHSHHPRVVTAVVDVLQEGNVPRTRRRCNVHPITGVHRLRLAKHGASLCASTAFMCGLLGVGFFFRGLNMSGKELFRTLCLLDNQQR